MESECKLKSLTNLSAFYCKHVLILLSVCSCGILNKFDDIYPPKTNGF